MKVADKIISCSLPYPIVITESARGEGGVSDKVFGVMNGTKVMVKTEYHAEYHGRKDLGRNAMAERFVYALAERLGLPCNKVMIDGGNINTKYGIGTNGGYVTIHVWQEGFAPAADQHSRETWQEQMKETVNIFDAIVANQDRHDWNWGFLSDKTVFLIDNGHCRPWLDSDELFPDDLRTDCENAIYALQNDSNPILRRFVTKLTGLTTEDIDSLFVGIPQAIRDKYEGQIRDRLKAFQAYLRRYTTKKDRKAYGGGDCPSRRRPLRAAGWERGNW